MQELQLFKFQKAYIHLHGGSHVGGKNCTCETVKRQITMFVLVQRTWNLVQRHVLWSYRSYQILQQIHFNSHSHVFDDVIWKSPIVWLHLLKTVKVVTYQEMIHAQFFMVFDKENEKHIWEPPHTSPQVLWSRMSDELRQCFHDSKVRDFFEAENANWCTTCSTSHGATRHAWCSDTR